MRRKTSACLATLLLCSLLLAGRHAMVRATEDDSDGGKTPAPAIRTDLLGDALPPGAVARLGSSRFRVDSGTASLVFGPDDTTLLACCEDHVRIWERSTGKLIRRFSVPNYYYAAFSPDATALALVYEHAIHIWDTASGKEIRKLPGPKTQARLAPVFTPDGKKLAAPGENEVVLYDCASGKLLRTLAVPGVPEALAFSPDGRRLAVARERSVAQLWNVASGKKIRDFQGTKDSFWQGCLCFSPNGKTVALCGYYSPVRVVEVASGKAITSIKFRHPVKALTFTLDGRALISGETLEGIQIWDLVAGKRKAALGRNWHQIPVLALSRDGKTLAAGARDGGCTQVRLWDVSTGKSSPLTPEERFRINLLAFAPDGQTVITADAINLQRWDARSGARKRQLRNRDGYYGSSDRVVAPDGKMAASPRWRSVEFWNLMREGPTREWKYNGKNRVCRVAFMPDGKHLVTAQNKFYPKPHAGLGEPPPVGLGKNSLHVWSLESGKVVRTLSTDRTCFYVSLVLTPDGNTAITGTAEGMIGEGFGRTDYDKGGPIYTWDLRSGREALTLEGHQGASRALAVSPDGRWLASGGYDKTVRLWELASGKTVFTFKEENWLQAIAISPRGSLLAISWSAKGHPPRIGLWDLTTGEEIHRFAGRSADAISLTFSPDGSRLASALADGTVLIWDMAPVYRAAERQPRKLQSGAWPALWDDLASLDALRAHRAVWTLVDAQDEAVALLSQQLRPAKVDAKRLKQLIADLDAPRFGMREAAARELARLGELAEPALLQALKGPPPLEVKKRLEPLLDYRRLFVRPEHLRRLRAIQVLENIGTAEARRILQMLATGDAEVRSTRAAAEALKRLR